MDDRLQEIFKKGKIESEEEHDIVFADWDRLMFSGGSLEEMMPHNKLLRKWEDKLEREAEEEE